jgi:DNA-binding MarR family transcriptional regulator
MISSSYARSLWVRLFSIKDILRNTSYSVLEEDIQVSYAELPIMQFFFESIRSAPAMKDLCVMTGLSSGAATQAVNMLVEDGYLERVQSDDDGRLTLIQATDKLWAFREKPLRHFVNMLDFFKLAVDANDLNIAEDIFLRLAVSRTGGELAAIRQPSDLTAPGLVPKDLVCREELNSLPVWMLLLHFSTNLKVPTMVYYYGKRGRTTLGKLRLMNHLFYLSDQKKGIPMVKDIAERFQMSPGVVTQTLNAMIQDGMVERVPSPLDRRAIGIRLTQQGLRMKRQCATSFTCFMQNFFSRIEPEKVEAFDRVLDSMLQFFKKGNGKMFLMPGEKIDRYG